LKTIQRKEENEPRKVAELTHLQKSKTGQMDLKIPCPTINVYSMKGCGG
jgi:hypothetical protein